MIVRTRIRSACAATLAAAGVLTACSAGPPPPAADEPAGELVVFAAVSLTDALSELSDAFTSDHPDVTVTPALAATQQLAGQIRSGAPADVFLSADELRMAALVDAGVVAGEPVAFATNRLAIAVEPGNPHRITGVHDLAGTDLLVALASPEVPAGAYTATALEQVGVTLSPVTLEADVRAVLTKVELGEVDAGIVYASDVVAGGGAVDGVDLPAEVTVRPVYPAAALDEAPNPVAARAFVAFLTSADAQEILARHGFGPPDAENPETAS